jgi:C-terminal processing protease CtpA/Prc
MRVASDAVCRGITVVSAFEGYAFDAGMRVGDRLLSVDGVPVQGRSVDQVSGLMLCR